MQSKEEVWFCCRTVTVFICHYVRYNYTGPVNVIKLLCTATLSHLYNILKLIFNVSSCIQWIVLCKKIHEKKADKTLLQCYLEASYWHMFKLRVIRACFLSLFFLYIKDIRCTIYINTGRTIV